MRIFGDFNEIKSSVGTEIGASDWIEISQERINQFAEATCDEQWIHVDLERARKELPGGQDTVPGAGSGGFKATWPRYGRRSGRCAA
jgi:acyl dehydratase